MSSQIILPNPSYLNMTHIKGIQDIRHGGSSAYLQNTLYYCYADSKERINVAHGNISSLRNVNDMDVNVLCDRENWGQLYLMDQIGNANGASMYTKHNMATIMFDEGFSSRIYFFWIDSANDNLYVAYLENGIFNPTAYKLQDTNGADIQLTNTYISAWNRAGKIVLSYTLPIPGEQKNQFNFVQFDPADISDTGSWQAIAQQTRNSMSTDITKLTTEWFSQGNGGDFALIGGLDESQSKLYVWLSSLNDQGLPVGANNWQLSTVSAAVGMSFYRKAAGNPGLMWGEPGTHAIRQGEINTFNAVNEGFTIDVNSNYAFNGTAYSDEFPTVVMISGDAYDSTYDFEGGTADTVNTPVYRVAFFGWGDDDNDSSDVCVAANYSGTAMRIPQYGVGTPKNDQGNPWIPSLIMDPFPVPNANLTGASANSHLVDFYFGTSSATSFEATSELSMVYGINTSLETTEGLGPVVDFQFKTGPQLSFADTFQYETTDARSVTTTAITGEDENLVISNTGVAHGGTIPIVYEQATVFMDNSGDWINGTLAPLFSMLVPDKESSVPVSLEYQTYLSNPGDIYSCTESAINARMKELYEGLTPEQQALLDPDYATNYFQEIVQPRINTMGGKSYLSFSISPAGSDTSTFNEVNSFMFSAGWTMDMTMYSGVYVGEGFDIFGIGEAIGFSVTAGFEFNMNMASSLTESNGWGITSDFDLPAGQEGYSYTVNMYLLQPDQLWTNELLLFGNATNHGNIVPDGAAPSKIIFVVQEDSISYNS